MTERHRIGGMQTTTEVNVHGIPTLELVSADPSQKEKARRDRIAIKEGVKTDYSRLRGLTLKKTYLG